MIGTTWLAYFEGNARADRGPETSVAAEVPAELRAPLWASLARFQLGESAGGRIHAEIATLPDRALDRDLRRAIQLYIEEEWRHARELALVIRSLDGQLLRRHWTNGAFTACRRLLGLQTKMMTLAIAEVIGIVYYRTLASRVGSPALATSLRRIAGEEARHLDFQADFFDHVIAARSRWLRPTYRALLRLLMLAVLCAALAVLLVDHREVLRLLGVGPRAIAVMSWQEISRRELLLEGRVARRGPPSYAMAHEPGS